MLERRAPMDLQRIQEVLNLTVKLHKSQLSMLGIARVRERHLTLKQRTLDQVLTMLIEQTARLKLKVMRHLSESHNLRID